MFTDSTVTAASTNQRTRRLHGRSFRDVNNPYLQVTCQTRFAGGLCHYGVLCHAMSCYTVLCRVILRAMSIVASGRVVLPASPCSLSSRLASSTTLHTLSCPTAHYDISLHLHASDRPSLAVFLERVHAEPTRLSRTFLTTKCRNGSRVPRRARRMYSHSPEMRRFHRVCRA